MFLIEQVSTSAYAMPGSDTAHGSNGLRERYVMPGTDIACGQGSVRVENEAGTSIQVLSAYDTLRDVRVWPASSDVMSGTYLAYMVVAACYAMSGTDLTYGATRCSTQAKSSAMQVCAVRYWHSVWCAMSGTGILHGVVSCGTTGTAYGRVSYQPTHLLRGARY
eukprot:3923748-Rhodomonas_salina.2